MKPIHLRKHISLVFMFLVPASVMALAQEAAPTPVVEIGTTFSAMTARPVVGVPGFTSFGGSETFVYNLNRAIGMVADLGGYHSESDVNFNPTTFTYLFGPRFTLRKASRFTPYVQALFGGARVSTDLLDSSGNSVVEKGFAQAFGGGVDVRLGDHIALKPIQVEYVMTRLPNIWSGSNSQNNVRYSAGVVIRLGSKP